MNKKLVQLYIPTTSSIYFGASLIWGLPYTVQIIGTLAVIAALLGMRLNNEPKHYDGQLVVERSEGGKLFSLQLNGDPEELEEQDSVSFKIVSSNE